MVQERVGKLLPFIVKKKSNPTGSLSAMRCFKVKLGVFGVSLHEVAHRWSYMPVSGGRIQHKMLLSIWSSNSSTLLSLNTILTALTSQFWKLIHREKVKKFLAAQAQIFFPAKSGFSLEAGGSEKAAGSHEPRLSPLLNGRHLVDGMRSGAVASSKFTSAHSAAVEEINK